MKTTSVRNAWALSLLIGVSLSPVCNPNARAQGTVQWGLTLTNINNPTAPVVVTNGDGSFTITAGGGDTWDNSDSFTYAYQEVTGDFDVRVRVKSLVATDPVGQDSQKGSLMARVNLTAGSPNIQINALDLNSGRQGRIESIGRFAQDAGTDDLDGTQGGGSDTTPGGASTYPDVWLRIQRQGDKFITYFANTNAAVINHPGDNSSYAIGTNGWQILCVAAAGTNFPKTMFVGLSTVAHNSTIDGAETVSVTYDSYGNTPNPPSIPTSGGLPVAATNVPGAFPNQSVLGVNWNISLPDDGLGYPGDIVQSAQGAPSQIIWNSGGFASVSRDMLLSIDSQTPGGFSIARYQAGALDFLIHPRDPVLAQQNLGPYSNPNRQRIANGDTNTPASQAWAPSPNYGFVIATVRKNGQAWNDTAPFFRAACYLQLDGVGSANAYDMIGGNFRGGHFYTRTTKLVTGPGTDPGSSLTGLQRCAIPLSVAYFPFEQGWKAAYFDSSQFDAGNPGRPTWKWGNGFGCFSGTAVSGVTNPLASASQLLTWVDTTGGGTYSGLATLQLPGENSLTNGLLFTVSNDEGGSLRGNYANNAPLPDGSGWYVAVRGIEESKSDPTVYATDSSSFSFVYVPFDSVNLIGARVKGGDGSVFKGAGTFSVQRLATGRYALAIPGKTGSDGMLLLQNSGYLANQPAGMTNVVDTSFLSYENGGTNTPANAFIIEARYLEPTGGPGGLGDTPLRDADFNFVWVDFQNPLAPPGSLPPSLNFTRNSGSLTLSWAGGAGYALQQTGVLSTNTQWSDLGTQNPQTIPIGSGNQFFRLIKP